jgi:hypothetical protein
MSFFIQIMHKFQEHFGPAMYKLNKGPDGKCLTDSSGTPDKFCAVQIQTTVKVQHLTKHFTVL